MIFPYLARLGCLCMAVFFLVHAALGLAVSALAPWAAGFARRLAPVHGARLLFALRLFPVSFALLVVAGVCTPSYLWLEPKGAPETTGLACLAAALAGLAVWGRSFSRAARALARSRRYLLECRERSRETRLPGERAAAWIVDGPPCVLLAGVLRPRLVISRGVLAALSADQLSAAIRHERAHAMARDNWKRLALVLAPGILPFAPGFQTIERAWAKLSEWAADDRAAAGKPRRSLALAAALVRVARLGSAPAPPALAASLMADGADLSERVHRLLHPVRPTARARDREPILAASAGLLVTGALAAVLAHPATLQSAHEFLELLIQ